MAFLPKSKVTRDIATTWTDLLTAGAGETAIVRGLQVPHVADPTRAETSVLDNQEHWQVGGGETLQRFSTNSQDHNFHMRFVPLGDITVAIYFDPSRSRLMAQAIKMVGGTMKGGPACEVYTTTISNTYLYDVSACKLADDRVIVCHPTTQIFAVLKLTGNILTAEYRGQYGDSSGTNIADTLTSMRVMPLDNLRVVAAWEQNASPSTFCRAAILTFNPAASGVARLTRGGVLTTTTNSHQNGTHRAVRANATGTPSFMMAVIAGTASGVIYFSSFREVAASPGNLEVTNTAGPNTGVNQGELSCFDLIGISTDSTPTVVMSYYSGSTSNVNVSYVTSALALGGINGPTVTSASSQIGVVFHQMQPGLVALIGLSYTSLYRYVAGGTVAAGLVAINHAFASATDRVVGAHAFPLGADNWFRDIAGGHCYRLNATGTAIISGDIPQVLPIGPNPSKRFAWHPTLNRWIYGEGQRLFYFDADFNLTGCEQLSALATQGRYMIRAVDVTPGGRIVTVSDNTDWYLLANSSSYSANGIVFCYGPASAFNVAAIGASNSGPTVKIYGPSTQSYGVRAFDLAMWDEDTWVALVSYWNSTASTSAGAVYGNLNNSSSNTTGFTSSYASNGIDSNWPHTFGGQYVHIAGKGTGNLIQFYSFASGNNTVYTHGTFNGTTFTNVQNISGNNLLNFGVWLDGGYFGVPSTKLVAVVGGETVINTTSNADPTTATTLRDIRIAGYDAANGYVYAYLNSAGVLTIEVRDKTGAVISSGGTPLRWTYTVPTEYFGYARLQGKSVSGEHTFQLGPQIRTVRRSIPADATLTIGVHKAGDTKPIELYRNELVKVGKTMEKQDPNPLVLQPGDKLVAKASAVWTFDALVSYLSQTA